MKGLWIPSTILLDSNLTHLQKLVLAEIIALSQGRYCTASNAHFADVLKINKPNCTRVIKKLVEDKYVTSTTTRKGKLIVERKIKAHSRYYQKHNNPTIINAISNYHNDNKLLSKTQSKYTLENTKESSKDTPPISSFKFDLWGQIKQAVNKSFEIHSTEADNKHFKQIQYDIREVIKTAKKNRGETPQANDTECMNVINKVLTNWPEWAKDKTPSYFRYNLTDILAHIRKSKSNLSKQYKKL